MNTHLNFIIVLFLLLDYLSFHNSFLCLFFLDRIPSNINVIYLSIIVYIGYYQTAHLFLPLLSREQDVVVVAAAAAGDLLDGPLSCGVENMYIVQVYC